MNKLTIGALAVALSLAASSAFAFSGADSTSSNGQGFAQPSVTVYSGDHRQLREGRQVDVGPQTYALPDTVPGASTELQQLYGTDR